MASADFRRALVGMQPQFRQMPPARSRSLQATLKPSCEARMAATYPPGPAPTTTRSYLSAISEGQGDGPFQDRDDRGEQLRAQRAVDDPVGAGQRQGHALANDDLIVLHHRLAAGGAHRQDGRLRRIDD